MTAGDETSAEQEWAELRREIDHVRAFTSSLAEFGYPHPHVWWDEDGLHITASPAAPPAP